MPVPKSLEDALPQVGFPLLLEIEFALASDSAGRGTVALTKVLSKRPVKLVEAIQSLAAGNQK